ncbi:MAG: isoleucine--tRNA ligase [Chloroherpetonaceae bacterium]|nr:isoleucine--tRNA ligase [Chloroherpetonaceae bacterium]
MNKFRDLSVDAGYAALESEVRAFWKKADIFEKSITSREGGRVFAFYEGPPTVNGKPGVHHVFSRTLKDLICRYKTLKGFQVRRQAGWDTHGLPVEIAVEKKLDLKSKSNVESFGIAQFNREAKDLVYYHIENSPESWEKLTDQMGYWCDMANPYITCTNQYIESVWWGIKQIFDKGLIYKDYKVVPQDPQSETVLSQAELKDAYKTVQDPSVYVKFKRKNANEFFLVWTTTPWTLVSNVCLAVGKEIDYVKVRAKNEILILAKERLAVLGAASEANPIEILEEFKGEALEHQEYEQLLPYLNFSQKAFYVVLGNFVSTSDGSGIVHCAPAFGADDYEVSKKYGLPMAQPIARNGRFTKEVPEFEGVFFKDADKPIIDVLKKDGKLFKRETYLHEYPFSPRYGVPVIYYARDSWYIRTTEIASKMIALNQEINWVPPEIGTGRFGNWLEENRDWAISRERFWGTPLPIWVSDDFKAGDDYKSGKMLCIGSIAELREGFIDLNGTPVQLGKALDENLVKLDLHRPFVDKIYFIKDGKRFTRTIELIDVWIDSGSMPWAQFHYPFENKERFESHYPADYIAEGIDQTRGWFYTLHALSAMIFGGVAYKNLIVNGHLLDKNGEKMSKSKGNVVDPFLMMDKYGADTLRWYLVSMSPPHLSKKFNEEELAEAQRKFFRAFIESYKFFALYANVDQFSYQMPRISVDSRTELDRWVLSSLNSLIRSVDKAMAAYDVTAASRFIEDFTVNQLSNWYIRRSRRRFWKGGSLEEGGVDKISAYQTLYECLIVLAKLASPFCPMIADEIYLNLNQLTGLEPFESVHLSFFPTVEETAIDLELEARMKRAQVICSLGLGLRKRAEIRVRQPLRRILVPITESKVRREIEKVKELILEELNIRTIEYVDDDSGIVSKKVKPNFKTLGKKFGKEVNAVANLLRSLAANQISTLEREGLLRLDLSGKEIEISLEDAEVLHEDLEGWLVASDDQSKTTIALDTDLDSELILEGLAREVVNRIQNLRKELSLDITDRIVLYLEAGLKIKEAIEKNKPYVMHETLASEIVYEINGHQSVRKEEIIGEENCIIAVVKI